GMSKKLNISNVPTIYMAIPPDSLQLVSSGFLVTPELETRISFYWKAIKENRIGPGVKPNPAVFNQPPANRQTGEPAAPILYK
ncbi:MAG: hypothetical protein HY265_06505, partial [Deltaproteobacteria bacterium]|nr:hypothetical protein [Deltaproteobacteria bacterium]